jgi:hypothetical protein
MFEYAPEPMIEAILNTLRDASGNSTETLDEMAKNPHTDSQEEQQEMDDTHE